MISNNNMNSPDNSNEKKSKDSTFCCRLYQILEDADIKNFADIISWKLHGRAFRVEKPQEFVKHVMPLMSRQTKWPSFQRQLHLYGFKRINEGKDKGCYYHKMFLRGKYHLVRSIRRITVNGRKIRTPYRSFEPDFYTMQTIDSDNDNSSVLVLPKRMEEYRGSSIDGTSSEAFSSSTAQKEYADDYAGINGPSSSPMLQLADKSFSGVGDLFDAPTPEQTIKREMLPPCYVKPINCQTLNLDDCDTSECASSWIEAYDIYNSVIRNVG